MKNTKICKKCGRILPIEKFSLTRGGYGNPYYRNKCKECEYEQTKEYRARIRNVDCTFPDSLELVIERKFKPINRERILDLPSTGLDIVPLGTDEIFVRLMDYRDTWFSNYGRVITRTYGKRYNLLKGTVVGGEMRYSVRKNVFIDGKWTYRHEYIYAAKMVVETFIVNEDKANNVYIWHSGHDKLDCYYRNLYPLNMEQFRVVSGHFRETGNDSEWFILNVMNDSRFKPDGWKSECMKKVMYGRGYHGISYTGSKNNDAYNRWHWMMNRCYSPAVHERHSEYVGCEVCDEWMNFSNFKLWYEENIKAWDMLGISVELDKDIIFKGNKVYSPDTVCLVPSVINTLFVNCKNKRGVYPIGVWSEDGGRRFRAGVTFMCKTVKLGAFDTVEEAFARYKEYKEDLIKDMAEQYKGKIPDKVYQAMVNWVIEIDD